MRLRAARAYGDETMTAVEQYDPDFCLRLSACTTQADADMVVQDWFERHLAGLKRTGETFKRVWGETRRQAGGTDEKVKG